MKEKLTDILLILSWREFSRHYFGKSSSWMYHKLDGIDPIKPNEKEKLKQSLIDLSERIKCVADKI